MFVFSSSCLCLNVSFYGPFIQRKKKQKDLLMNDKFRLKINKTNNILIIKNIHSKDINQYKLINNYYYLIIIIFLYL